MKEKKDTKSHEKHRKKIIPLDAFELYELEHMPRTIDKAAAASGNQSIRANSSSPGVVEPASEKVRKKTNGNDVSAGAYDENINSEAEKFIAFEHEKFQLRKWMSLNIG